MEHFWFLRKIQRVNLGKSGFLKKFWTLGAKIEFRFCPKSSFLLSPKERFDFLGPKIFSFGKK